MKYQYEKEHKITYSQVNQKIELDTLNAVMLVQDMTTELFETFQSDNIRVRNKNNAVWVVTKTKLHFYRHPKWLDTIKQQSYITKNTPARVNIESIFKDENGELYFVAKQESCVIDVTTRKIRKINTISYPQDMEETQSIYVDNFLKLNDQFNENDKVYRQKVMAADIDFSNHTNNAMYVRVLVNAVPSNFWNDKKVTDFEIHYINESREGEELTVYKKESSGKLIGLIKSGDKEIVRVQVCYETI